HKQAPKGEAAVNRAPVKANSSKRAKQITKKVKYQKGKAAASDASKSKVPAKEQILETSTSKSEVLAKHHLISPAKTMTQEN
ncbi:29231_t:CDS:2, partial [Racocetra persica]